jgi:hypothetical protein
MSCYSPLTGIWLGDYTETGKKNYRVVSTLNGELALKQRALEVIPIPCGQCLGCRLDYSKKWAVRCILESSYYKDNYFLTLTYDDEHLPKNSSLVKRDLQLFLKRLRKYIRTYTGLTGVRFYACGEYGEKSMRPHYHVILFNCPLNDLKLLKRTCLNNNLYTSEAIAKLWPQGLHSVGEVTYETCAYTARYVIKKHKGLDSKWYELHNLAPEFVLMSRRPGIGEKYYNDHKDDIYATDEIIVKSSDKVISIKPVQYYDKKFDLENPELLAALKDVRKRKAELYQNNLSKNAGLSPKELLNKQKELKSMSVSHLVRTHI